MNHKVLISITTANKSNWEKQFADIKELGIDEFAVFLTGLAKPERDRLFSMLQTISDVSIPFIHARDDMQSDEFEQYIKHFGTQYFNVHPSKFFEPKYDLSALKQQILLENTPPGYLFAEDELKKYAGICLDLSHMEDSRLAHTESYNELVNYLARHTVFANHISCVDKHMFKDSGGYCTYSRHTLTNLNQLDYLNNYPEKYFGAFVAIELTNDIKTQLEAKKYIENILAKK